jgi:hypothetical protein
MSPYTTFRFISSLVLASNAVACSAAVRDAGSPTPPMTATARVCPGTTVSKPSDVRALSGCTVVRGDLDVVGSRLESLAGLESLRAVTGRLRINHNPNLTSVDGLSRLRSVDALVLRENPKLESLAGIASLRRARRVTLDGSPRLDDLEGLGKIRKLESLVVARTGVASTRGLGELREIGHLSVLENPKLISLSGLRNLGAARSVRIEKNSRLAGQVGFLRALAGVKGPVVIDGNAGISEAEADDLVRRLRGVDDVAVASR